MAKVRSLFHPRGSVGDACFTERFGETFLAFKPGPSSHAWHTAKEFERSRENSVSFGGASRVACAYYATLGPLKRLCAPYTHNRLAGVVLKANKGYLHALTEPAPRNGKWTGRVPAHYKAENYAHVLSGVDLAFRKHKQGRRPAPAADDGYDVVLFKTPVPGQPTPKREPQMALDPHPAKRHIRLLRGGRPGTSRQAGTFSAATLAGLAEAAKAIPLRAGEVLEARVHLQYAALPDYLLEPSSGQYVQAPTPPGMEGACSAIHMKALWMPAPEEDLTLQVAVPEGLPQGVPVIVTLGIEWRACKGGRRAVSGMRRRCLWSGPCFPGRIRKCPRRCGRRSGPGGSAPRCPARRTGRRWWWNVCGKRGGRSHGLRCGWWGRG